MKLKTVELNGKVYAEVQDDKPVFVEDDGKEIPVDVAHSRTTITRLNGESRNFRERAEAAEGKLKQFEGITDPEEARRAIELAKNIKDGELVAAGKVEEIKAAAKRAAEEQVAAVNKANAEALAQAQAERDQIKNAYYGEKVGSAFKGSKFIAEKVAIPPDLVQARFGSAVKVEDDRLVAYDAQGNKIFSRSRPGEVADLDEALEIIIEQYPYKDHILKGSEARGDGATRSTSTTSGKKQLTRAEFEAIPPQQRSSKIAEGFTVVDAR